ncbi:DUF2897 family protein [Thalassotalea ponticola]|uniref:DUF2897 family protein n=1 Tax=Thalassotalea ponticola TaxID=1523392 RepID=UPI0025B5E9F2|nr:DUF2897 family protein [Thalassotalea ponticola]MDN3653194.1 DUF2897 family protein [Thalassotalea ponticola]
MFKVILLIALAFIISGVYLLYKSAKKFNLSEQQLERIKQRNQELERQEREHDERP